MPSTSKSKLPDGKNYKDLLPKLNLPKSIPQLQFPVSIGSSELKSLDKNGLFSLSDEMIGMQKIRK